MPRWVAITRNQILLLAIYLVPVLLSCWPVLHVSGYPYNQSGLHIFERVEIFRLAIESGDLFPIWTPLANQGYGSIFPLALPRLYYQTIGFLAYFLGTSELAVKVSVPLLLTLGAMGMHHTARQLGLKFTFCLSAAILLLFANHTYTNWLLRMAMSEFTAAMLIPWFIYYGLKVSQRHPFAEFFLGIVTTLLFVADYTIASYALISMLIFLVFSWQRSQHFSQQINAFLRRTLRLFSTALVIPLTFVWLMQKFKIWTYLEAIEPDTINTFYRPPLSYIADTVFDWGLTWEGASVEVGRAIAGTLIILFLLTGFFWGQKTLTYQALIKAINLRFLSVCIFLTFVYIQYDWFRPLYPEYAWVLWGYGLVTIGICIFLLRYFLKHFKFISLREKSVVCLSLIATIFLYLQLPLSLWFYESIPHSDLIFFPWKLLAFVTPSLILVLCERLDSMTRLEPKFTLANIYRGALGIILINQVLFGLRIQNIQYERYPSELLQQALTPRQLMAQVNFPFDRELFSLPDPVESTHLLASDNCQVLMMDPSLDWQRPSHFTELHLIVQAPTACTLRLRPLKIPLFNLSSDRALKDSDNSLIHLTTGRHQITLKRRSILQLLIGEIMMEHP